MALCFLVVVFATYLQLSDAQSAAKKKEVIYRQPTYVVIKLILFVFSVGHLYAT